MDYLKTLEEIKGKCAWLSNYGLVSKLIDEINAKKMIEIGVAYGFHSECISKSRTNTPNISTADLKGTEPPCDIIGSNHDVTSNV